MEDGDDFRSSKNPRGQTHHENGNYPALDLLKKGRRPKENDSGKGNEGRGTESHNRTLQLTLQAGLHISVRARAILH